MQTKQLDLSLLKHLHILQRAAMAKARLQFCSCQPFSICQAVPTSPGNSICLRYYPGSQLVAEYSLSMGFYAQCIMNLDDIFEKEFDTQNRPCFDRLRCQGMAAQMSLPLIGLQVAARGFTRPQMALLAPVLMRDA